MSLPPTLLSLIYHGTIARFRDEMHAHPTQAFKRFNITTIAVKNACLAVDDAAFQLRSNPQSVPALTALENTSKVLFDLLAPLLAAEINAGVPGPNQPVNGSNGPDARLLTDLYRLFYSSDFRNTDPPPPALDPPPVNPTKAQVDAAWNGVKAALAAGGGASQADAKVLSDRMQVEFASDIWTFIW